MYINHATDSTAELACVPHHGSFSAANRIARIVRILLLIGALALVTACGPERADPDTDQLTEETILIAQTYAQDGNRDSARLSLQTLDVANPMQWLVLQTETSIAEKSGAPETQALAALAIDLGSQSHSILEYGSEVGIVATAESASSQAATIGGTPADNASSEVSQPVEVASVPTVAVIPLPSTEEAPALDVIPTATPEPAVEAPAATDTPIPVPRIVASTSMNVRSGPGTAYPIVDALGAGETADIVAKNATSDWWQVALSGEQLGWVFGQLVQTSGGLGEVAVASDIPEPPEPTATPVPVIEAPAEEEQPAEEVAAPAGDGPDFRVVEKRLWDVYENGGSLSGPTVTCGEKRQLIVRVVDANGSLINGVAVQEEFGAKDIEVTGAQGKGDGTVEFILGRGQDVRVIRDSDGRDVTSEVARGMVTEPAGIPYDALIAGQYCSDDDSCKKFVDAPGCWGHYSWTVTFQRSY